MRESTRNAASEIRRAIATLCVCLFFAAPSFGDDAPTTNVPMPDILRPHGPVIEVYPKEAKEQHIEGRVTIEFSIDGDGVPYTGRLKSADSQVLVQGAAKMIQGLRFKVPKDWESSGASKNRYVLAVTFALRKNGWKCKAPVDETVNGDTIKTIAICGDQ